MFLVTEQNTNEKISNNQIYDCLVFSIICLQTKSLRWLGRLTCLPDLVVAFEQRMLHLLEKRTAGGKTTL